MLASRTMDDLRAPADTWSTEVKMYEQEKRRAVDEGLVNSKQVRVTGGQVKLQERCFDPLLQRFRDNSTELQQRTLEERERVGHLNRAYDISILRGQPFNILNHESKIEHIAPGVDPMRTGHEKPRNKEAGRPGANHPDTSLDYNILSNIPHEHHHWARPEARPHIKTKMPAQRLVPAFLVKDFNIVSNRYTDGHEDRVARDKQLQILEAAQKYAQRNRFDPVTQQFNDPKAEEHNRTADDARTVELTMRLDNMIPPTTKGRQSNHYDIVSHQIHDPEIIGMYDTHEAERKQRFKNRHIVEHNLHKQDIKGDHINESRKLNRIAPERYQEDAMRGYDIVNGKRYGRLPEEKLLHTASTKPRLTPWEKIQESKNAKVSEMPRGAWLSDGAYLESLDGSYWSDGKGGDRAASADVVIMPSRLAASASAPALGAEPRSGTSGEKARSEKSAVRPDKNAARSERSAASGGSRRREERAGGDGYRAAPAPVAMPPGQTAPPPRIGAAAMVGIQESGTLQQAGARALQPSNSATQIRSGGGDGASSRASGGSRQPSLRQESGGYSATALGNQATLRLPPSAAAPTMAAPRGMSSMAPAAPAVPGSPGGGSVYSRRL